MLQVWAAREGLNSAAATQSSLSVAVHTGSHSKLMCSGQVVLHVHSRCRHAIIGDGNYLFRIFFHLG